MILVIVHSIVVSVVSMRFKLSALQSYSMHLCNRYRNNGRIKNFDANLRNLTFL